MEIDVPIVVAAAVATGGIIVTLIGVIWRQRDGVLKDLKDAIDRLNTTLVKQNEANDLKLSKIWEAIRALEKSLSTIKGMLKIKE